MTAESGSLKNTELGNKMEENKQETRTIVICQCCQYQFFAEVEECRQDIDLGYVCKDCYTLLKWAGAYMKAAGMPKCSQAFNNRDNETTSS